MNSINIYIRHALLPLLLSAAVLSTIGCNSSYHRAGEQFGKVFYLDGAGNLGFGYSTVPNGLRAAGFKGNVEPFIWTTFTGPLTDQLLRINAMARADLLRKRIERYKEAYPTQSIHIIGLSAGTGVAAWAVEALPKGVSVDNMVLLGSSLSTTFDMTKCLAHVKNKVYVIYSPHDPVLTSFVPITGTIDGVYFVKSAGLVGLSPPHNASDKLRILYRNKIVNIPWRREFERYGYTGNHTDATNSSFVRWFARKLLGISKPVPGGSPSQPRATASTL